MHIKKRQYELPKGTVCHITSHTLTVVYDFLRSTTPLVMHERFVPIFILYEITQNKLRIQVVIISVAEPEPVEPKLFWDLEP